MLVARFHTCTSKFHGHEGVGIGPADLRQILGPIDVDQHLTGMIGLEFRPRGPGSSSQDQLQVLIQYL